MKTKKKLPTNTFLNILKFKNKHNLNSIKINFLENILIIKATKGNIGQAMGISYEELYQLNIPLQNTLTIMFHKLLQNNQKIKLKE